MNLEQNSSLGIRVSPHKLLVFRTGFPNPTKWHPDGYRPVKIRITDRAREGSQLINAKLPETTAQTERCLTSFVGQFYHITVGHRSASFVRSRTSINGHTCQSLSLSDECSNGWSTGGGRFQSTNSSYDHPAPEGASPRTAVLTNFAAEQYGHTLSDFKSDILCYNSLTGSYAWGSPVF